MSTRTRTGPGPVCPPPAAPPPEIGPATTRCGWLARLRQPTVPPDLKDCAPAGTPVNEDDPRVRYHGRLGKIPTTDINNGLKTAHRLLLLNREADQRGAAHIAIDSDCRGTGKRFLAHHIGLAHQGRVEKLHGIDEHRIPVVCINTPLSPNSYAEWSAALATFLGWDVYRPGTDHQPQLRMKDLTGPVVHVLRGARTKLCLVDGIDRLGPTDLQPTFDYFDHLGDELGGLTVFWNGLGSSDILREARTRSSPLRRVTEKTAEIRPRAVPTLWVNRIPGRSKEHPDEWVKVLASLNELLRLHRQPAKGLLDHEEFLHIATDGLMEHLVPLTGTAAQLAILEGDEAITSNLLKEAAAYLDIPHPTDDPGTAEGD
ncbi:hypothetical protein AB0A71_30390 [Kitasatospora aureofaciens]|uniref:hypothetical protein n=1 Tax=Kitasatospora aureofaciens TaxID=1894 RepID=UPI0033CFD687